MHAPTAYTTTRENIKGGRIGKSLEGQGASTSWHMLTLGRQMILTISAPISTWVATARCHQQARGRNCQSKKRGVSGSPHTLQTHGRHCRGDLHNFTNAKRHCLCVRNVGTGRQWYSILLYMGVPLRNFARPPRIPLLYSMASIPKLTQWNQVIWGGHVSTSCLACGMAPDHQHDTEYISIGFFLRIFIGSITITGDVLYVAR
jgi:hypothetical protein